MVEKNHFQKRGDFSGTHFFCEMLHNRKQEWVEYGGGGGVGLMVVFTWYWCGQNEGQ